MKDQVRKVLQGHTAEIIGYGTNTLGETRVQFDNGVTVRMSSDPVHPTVDVTKVGSSVHDHLEF